MIYDTGSETVSLAGGRAESLAFDEHKQKVDLSAADSSFDMIRNLQNPMYATSQFTAPVPKLSEDRTLFNPVYEAVATEPSRLETEDLPEKVIPSPEDFVAPLTDDTKPLVATTNATGTTTVTNGERYEPGAPVPIEVQNEPQYATVLPKHKRATAKPFAADGDESDDD